MRALALSTMETNAAATCGPCCAAAECFRLKAEATGSMINRQVIVDRLRGCGGVLPPEGGSHGIDDQPPKHRLSLARRRRVLPPEGGSHGDGGQNAEKRRRTTRRTPC